MDARDGTFLVRDASSGCGKFVVWLRNSTENERRITRL